MAKYIDAKKLRYEVERMKESGCESPISICDDILMFIDYLQEEQPEVDFETELDEWMKFGPHTSYPWCTIPDAIKITAEHFFNLRLTQERRTDYVWRYCFVY